MKHALLIKMFALLCLPVLAGAQENVNSTISKEILKPAIEQAEKAGKAPDWTALSDAVEKKYDKDRAFTTVMGKRLEWHYKHKEWNDWLDTVMQIWQVNGKEFKNYGWMYLNHLAWTMAVHSNDKNQLQAALQWADMGVAGTTKPEVPIMDTKANVLYKLGKSAEAIALQEQVVALVKKEADAATDNLEYHRSVVTYFQSILDKMKKGEPIQLKD